MREYIPGKDREFTEQIIAAAGDYVTASDDLRPRVVEAAREVEDGRRAYRLLGCTALALSVLIAVAIPMSRSAERLRREMRGPSGKSVMNSISRSNGSSDQLWQLVDYFSSVPRGARADHPGQVDRLLPSRAPESGSPQRLDNEAPKIGR